MEDIATNSDLMRDLNSFIKEKDGSWNHDDWISFVDTLRDRGHEFDINALGYVLEEQKRVYSANRTRTNQADLIKVKDSGLLTDFIKEKDGKWSKFDLLKLMHDLKTSGFTITKNHLDFLLEQELRKYSKQDKSLVDRRMASLVAKELELNERAAKTDEMIRAKFKEKIEEINKQSAEIKVKEDELVAKTSLLEAREEKINEKAEAYKKYTDLDEARESIRKRQEELEKEMVFNQELNEKLHNEKESVEKTYHEVKEEEENLKDLKASLALMDAELSSKAKSLIIQEKEFKKFRAGLSDGGISAKIQEKETKKAIRALDGENRLKLKFKERIEKEVAGLQSKRNGLMVGNNQLIQNIKTIESRYKKLMKSLKKTEKKANDKDLVMQNQERIVKYKDNQIKIKENDIIKKMEDIDQLQRELKAREERIIVKEKEMERLHRHMDAFHDDLSDALE